jgi:hypothetical protein
LRDEYAWEIDDYQLGLKNEIEQQRPMREQSVLDSLKALGWQHASLPEFRITVNDDNLYIGGECTPEIQHNPDQLEVWMKTVLRLRLSQEKIDRLSMHVDAHDHPDCHGFNIELDEASQSVVAFPKSFSSHAPLSRSARLLLIGDALRKPHYHTASGAVLALLEAQLLGEFLRSPQSKQDWKQYAALVEKLREDNRARVDNYLHQRKLRESNGEAEVKKAKLDSTSDDQAAERDPVKSELDEAYKLLGIPRFSLYVGDLQANILKLHELYLAKVEGVYPKFVFERAHQIIFTDLQARLLKANTNFLAEFTSSQQELIATNHVCLAFREQQASVTSEVRPDNIYHFYHLDLAAYRDGYKLQTVQYCQFVITGAGKCKLVMPTWVRQFYDLVSTRFGFKVYPRLHGTWHQGVDESLCMNKARDGIMLALEARFDRRPQVTEALGDANIELSDDEVNDALATIHRHFCATQNLTVEAFIENMRAKIQRVRGERNVEESGVRGGSLLTRSFGLFYRADSPQRDESQQRNSLRN